MPAVRATWPVLCNEGCRCACAVFATAAGAFAETAPPDTDPGTLESARRSSAIGVEPFVDPYVDASDSGAGFGVMKMPNTTRAPSADDTTSARRHGVSDHHQPNHG